MAAPKLINKQYSIRDQLLYAINNFKKTEETRLTGNYLSTRLVHVERLWESFSNNELDLLSLDNIESIREENDYFVHEVYQVTEMEFFNYMAELKDCLDEVQRLQNIRSNHSAPSGDLECQPNSQFKPEIRLPTIHLPRFNGDYNQWRSFHDLFVSLIHNDSRIPLVQKLHYLKSSLTGEAERLLRHYQVIESNYMPAWDVLVKRYDNKRVLVNVQLKILFGQSIIRVESAQEIKRLLDQSVECLNELKALGVPVDHWDTMIIHLMVKRLPDETHNLWEQSLGNNGELPTFEQLVSFLETRYRTLEAVGSNRFRQQNVNIPQSKKELCMHHETRNFTRKFNNCYLCHKPHSIYKCNQFLNMDVKERQTFISRKSLCQNCLNFHPKTNCSSTYNCAKCGKKHHTLLHQFNRSDGRMSDSKNNNPNKSGDVNKDLTPTVTMLSTKVTSKVQPQQQYQTLLATALVNIKNTSGEIMTMRALLDSGSQTSFVTQNAVQKLGLKEFDSSVVVTGLEQSKSIKITKRVCFQMMDYFNSFEIPVEAFVIKKISNILPAQRIDNQNWTHIRHLKLADPTYNKPGKIDILIGAEIYAQLLVNGLRIN